MAVTARRLFLWLVLSAGSGGLRADQPADIRAELSQIANALSAGNPADAMTPFSQSFAAYNQLRDDFTGLTNAFSIENEVDVLEEQDSPAESVVSVRWAITLTDKQTNFNTQRAAEVHLRFVCEKSKWRILDLTPVDLFDPANAQKANGQRASSSRSFSYAL